MASTTAMAVLEDRDGLNTIFVIEQKLGYKIVKYIKSIEFVDDLKAIKRERGGYREDNVMFDWEASIWQPVTSNILG